MIFLLTQVLTSKTCHRVSVTLRSCCQQGNNGNTVSEINFPGHFARIKTLAITDSKMKSKLDVDLEEVVSKESHFACETETRVCVDSHPKSEL